MSIVFHYAGCWNNRGFVDQHCCDMSGSPDNRELCRKTMLFRRQSDDNGGNPLIHIIHKRKESARQTAYISCSGRLSTFLESGRDFRPIASKSRGGNFQILEIYCGTGGDCHVEVGARCWRANPSPQCRRIHWPLLRCGSMTNSSVRVCSCE